MPPTFSRREVLFGGAGLLLCGTAEATARAASRPRRAATAASFAVRRHELTVDGLDPAHDGLRVAHLSDIHVGAAPPDERVLEAVRQVNAERPDVIFLTGDFVTFSRRPVARVGPLLAGLEAPTFAVLGNHDHWVDGPAVRRELEGRGYAVLQNAWTALPVRGAALHVVGVDDGRTGHDDVARAFKGVPKRGTRLVLAHTPPTADRLAPDQNLVCFSGHTHGGQIRVGELTDAIARAIGQPYVRGMYRVRGNDLFVNAGLGYGRHGPMMRVGVPPEVAYFTLRAS